MSDVITVERRAAAAEMLPGNVPARRRRPRSARSREAWACYAFIAPALLYLIFMAAGPVLASFVISFTYWDILTPPQWIGFDNYREMFFQDPRFWVSLWNTLYFVAWVVPLGTILPFLVALLLNTKVRGQAIYRTCFYLPSIVPVVASSLLWLWILNPEYGPVNSVLGRFGIHGPAWMTDPAWSKPAIIIVTIWGMAGGPSMLIYLAGLQGVPQSLYEAAAIDGAGRFQQFINVVIPMMSPYLLFSLIMGFISAFQVFTQAYVMTLRGGGGPADSTLFYVLYLYQKAFRQFEMGYACAMAWFLFLIVLIVTIIQFKVVGKRVHLRSTPLQRLIAHVVLIAGSLMFLFPLFWMVSTSFKDQADVYAFPPRYLPTHFQWQNYTQFKDIDIPRFYLNTVWLVTVCVFGNVVTAALVAYGFARLRAPGRDGVFAVFLATMMLPPQVTMIPVFILFQKLGWINTYWPIIVPAFLGGGAFNVFLLRQFFMTLPRELEEAAEMDGASRLAIFTRIALPLSRPALVTVAVFAFMWHWNDFLSPLLYLQDTEKYTLALGLNLFKGMFVSKIPWGPLMAASTLMVLPVIVVFFLLQRYFVEGITLTGVKG